MLATRLGRQVAVAAAIAAAATTAIVVAAPGGGHDQAGAPESASTPATSYAALRKAPVKAGDVNPFVIMTGLAAEVPGLDPAQARALTVSGRQAWVAASPSTICIAASSPKSPDGFSSACAPIQNVNVQGLWLSTRPAPSDLKRNALPAGYTEVIGLLPDGTSDVQVTTASGKSRTLAVSGNVAAAVFSERPGSARVTTPNAAPANVQLGG